MATYRERRLAKAERLRDWAVKREEKAASAFKAAHTLADMIPMGQPILVDHHSEGRARRDAERNRCDQSIEIGAWIGKYPDGWSHVLSNPDGMGWKRCEATNA